MTEFVQSIIILAIIGVMAFFLYRYYQYGKKAPEPGPSGADSGKKAGSTKFFTNVVIAELDRSGKIKKKADVTVKIGDKKGFSVGTSDNADFKITSLGNAQAIHFKVGRDEAGYYVRDCSKTVGTYCAGHTYRDASFDLPFEKVIYASNVPIVFIEKPKVRLDKTFRFDAESGASGGLTNNGSVEDDVLKR